MINKILLFILIPFVVNGQAAFISGNDTICDNSSDNAQISVSFSGTSPFSFSFAIDGVPQSSITTSINPYIISTNISGSYTLVSYNDANSFGLVSGSGLVTVLESPTALIYLGSDTLSIINPIANFVSQSIGDIVNWTWDFGDNSSNQFSSDISHLYNDSSAIYQVSLIVVDSNGCLDTTINHIWVRNEFFIYIPDSFSPNADMINDKFCIEYSGILEKTFLFKVMDSESVLVFESTDPTELRCSLGNGWGGEYFVKSSDLPFDTYVYEIYFQDFEGWKHKEYGVINLIR